MATYFDTTGIVFSNDDAVFDLAPLSPSAGIDEIREYVNHLDQWRRIREQLAAGGVLAKMVTFRDLVKYGLLDLSNAGIFDPPDDDGSAGVSGVQLACSDLTSDLEVNAVAGYFRAAGAFTLGSVRASLQQASVSGAVSIAITLNGSSILSTALTIDVNEKTSTTAATPAALSTTAIPDDGEIIVEIVSAGSAARGLEVTFIPA